MTAIHFKNNNPEKIFRQKWLAVVNAKKELKKEDARIALMDFVLNELTPEIAAKIITNTYYKKWYLGKAYGLQILIDCLPILDPIQSKKQLIKIINQTPDAILKEKFNYNHSSVLRFSDSILHAIHKIDFDVAELFFEKINATERNYNILFSLYHARLIRNNKLLLTPSDYQKILERCNKKTLHDVLSDQRETFLQASDIAKSFTNFLQYSDITNIQTCIKVLSPALFVSTLKEHSLIPLFRREMSSAINKNLYLSTDEKVILNHLFSLVIKSYHRHQHRMFDREASLNFISKFNKIINIPIEEMVKNFKNATHTFVHLELVCDYLIMTNIFENDPNTVSVLNAYLGKINYARYESFRDAENPEFSLQAGKRIPEELRKNHYKTALNYWYNIPAPSVLAPHDNAFIAEILMGSTTMLINEDIHPNDLMACALIHANIAACSGDYTTIGWLQELIDAYHKDYGFEDMTEKDNKTNPIKLLDETFWSKTNQHKCLQIINALKRGQIINSIELKRRSSESNYISRLGV